MHKRLWLLVAMSLVGTGTMFNAPTPAEAYTNDHCKQPNILVYTRVGGSSTYKSASTTALNDWKATSTPFTWSPASSGYKLNIDEGAYGSSGYDGITYRYCGSGTQTAAANSYYNDFYTNKYAMDGKVQVMVHEIGHALGLGHAGTSTCSGQPIMYYASTRWSTCKHVKPQADDINGINAIY